MGKGAAVVLGLDANALGAVRALARAGHRVFAVGAAARNPVEYSRYGTKIALRGSRSRHEAFRVGLRRVAELTGGERAILIPCCDPALDVMLEDRSLLERRFRFLLPATAVVDTLMDKWRFATAAEEAGLRAPGTWLLSSAQEIPDRPLVLKPRRRFGRSGALLERVRLVADLAELEELRLALVGDPDEYIVQERIPGDDDRVEFYGGCWKDGQPVVEFTGAKIRQYPPGSGSTACARITQSDEVRALARRLLSRLGFEGCVDVEFKRGPDGSRFLIEVNPRPGLWHTLGELAGVSLPVAACAVLNGEPVPPSFPPRLGKRWVYLERDFRAVLERRRAGDAALAQFVRDLLRARRFAVLSLTDPLPFLRRFLRIGAGGVSRLLGAAATPQPPRAARRGAKDNGP